MKTRRREPALTSPRPDAPRHRLAPQKIDSVTRSCVYNSAFYSQGAVICLGGGRGLQCNNGSWIGIQEIDACKEQAPTPPAR
jgi:hypothetical protein